MQEKKTKGYLSLSAFCKQTYEWRKPHVIQDSQGESYLFSFEKY